MTLVKPMERLTPKQLECLRRYARRSTAKEIGKAMGITHHAVEKHLAAVRQKLGVETTLEAVRLLEQATHTVEPYYCPNTLPGGFRDAPRRSPPAADEHEPASLLRDVASEQGPYRYDLSPRLILIAIGIVMIAIVTAMTLMAMAGQSINNIALPIWQRLDWLK